MKRLASFFLCIVLLGMTCPAMSPFFFAQFSIKNIPECELWLDGQDSSSLTISGSQVSQWNDKSGQGHNAIQATMADQPGYGSTLINGHPGLTFPGGSQNLVSSLALTQPWSLYVVGYDTVGNSTIIAGDGLNIFNFDGTNVVLFPFPSSPFFGAINDIPHCLIFVLNSGVVTCYRDGVPFAPTGSSTASSTAVINIGSGAGQPNGGAILGEVAIYSRAISAQEANALHYYSQRKWGTP